MHARVTISLPAELLELLDSSASQAGVSRSELVQESVSSYLSMTAEQREVEARRRHMLDALEGMRSMRSRYPVADTRPSLEILREVRTTDDAAPLRGMEGADD